MWILLYTLYVVCGILIVHSVSETEFLSTVTYIWEDMILRTWAHLKDVLSVTGPRTGIHHDIFNLLHKNLWADCLENVGASSVTILWASTAGYRDTLIFLSLFTAYAIWLSKITQYLSQSSQSLSGIRTESFVTCCLSAHSQKIL
jgi:hypothetical protein